MSAELLAYISRRKNELGAVIMAHYYQLPEIQDAADFVGDSLELARQAAVTDARVIVFCGVRFMAESAKILNPDKTVILPEPQAGCPMADMVDADGLKRLKELHPGAMVVCYVNSSAEVKAESDICCTSSNAISVVRSIPADREIIFVPDRNLGSYIQRETGRDMILWAGCCPVHDALSRREIEAQKTLHPARRWWFIPNAAGGYSGADAVLSTAGILKHVENSPENEFIIGTEEGLLHRLRKNSPHKKFYMARSGFSCADMKLIRLEKLANAMETLSEQVDVAHDIRQKAMVSLQRMLQI
ncbi:quinolinate synthase NadA [Syntrophomonas palmitatica]|uniref:quinolinate synthase NadA n=1 Tax=Syntrophomonas palmitatica TaxID=402877 RepID=UPI0009FAA193|nr:quinolinate synthase NadA [Syntrophomonas palmitatica]